MRRIECGTRVNIVPNEAEAVLGGIDVPACKALLERVGELRERLEVRPGDAPDECRLLAHGVASHAAMPENGVNAAAYW